MFGKSVSHVLPARAVGLKRPTMFWKLLGAVAAMLAAAPFLTTPAKAGLNQWANANAAKGPVLQEQTRQPGKYLQVAGHTDVPHQDSNPHGDQTDPWGNHVDVADHVDGAHMDATSDDSGGQS